MTELIKLINEDKLFDGSNFDIVERNFSLLITATWNSLDKFKISIFELSLYILSLLIRLSI